MSTTAVGDLHNQLTAYRQAWVRKLNLNDTQIVPTSNQWVFDHSRGTLAQQRRSR